MQIDPSSYAIAVQQAEAQVAQAKAVAQNAEAEFERRQKLNNLAVTVEEQQTYASQSLSAGQLSTPARQSGERPAQPEARESCRRSTATSPICSRGPATTPTSASARCPWSTPTRSGWTAISRRRSSTGFGRATGRPSS